MSQTKPSPTPTFASLGLPASLVEVLTELGYERPTPVQAESIPLLLKGVDVVGESRTGSGKTAAFSLPILAKTRVQSRRLQALVLCPTRELCAQVAREMRKLGRRHPGLQVLLLSGGQPIRPQLDALERGAHIAVGTPGRVLDHLRRGRLDLSRIATVVLDEADRMLDMGFQEDMEEILGALPEARQTVLFSATYPDTIDAMSNTFQRQPQRVTIETDEKDAPLIKQRLYEVDREDKVDALRRLLAAQQPRSALVFCNFKAVVADVSDALKNDGLSAASLHGDLEQFDRDRIMATFRNGSVRVLVATDVAARGIDVADLDLVVNLDLPPTPETYVHRIGRSGRAGKEGLAVSFATPREDHKIEAIEALTGQTIERRMLSTLQPAKQAPSPASEQSTAMSTLMISGGRKDKLRPGDILGALTGDAAGLSGAQIGKIEIHDRLAYVAVAQSVAKTALSRLQQGRIKGRRFAVSLA